jgi:hypothetical protein
MWTKSQAEAALKPFIDRLRRRGGECLVFWERQKRGSWHPHVLYNKYFEIGGRLQGGLRDWMMARGWGVQMKIRFVSVPAALFDPDRSYGFREKDRPASVRAWRLVRYLTKYLTKSFTDVDEPKKKLFGGSSSAKAGTVKFRWTAEIEPSAYLYHYGRELFYQVEGRAPTWRETQLCVRYGVEATDWLSIDPWCKWAMSDQPP